MESEIEKNTGKEACHQLLCGSDSFCRYEKASETKKRQQLGFAKLLPSFFERVQEMIYLHLYPAKISE